MAALRIRWDGTLPVERVADEVIAYVEAGAAWVAIHFGEHGGTRSRMEALARRLAGRWSIERDFV